MIFFVLEIILFILILLFLFFYWKQFSHIDYFFPKLKKSCIAIGGTLYNCEKYIHSVFKNILRIGSLYSKFYIIIAIDLGDDDSLSLLKDWQQRIPTMEILIGKKTSKIRTENLAIARNKILHSFRNKIQDFDYFIMMDCDDVCSQPIDLNVFQNSFSYSWDAISFFKPNYYDIWALSYDPFMISNVHWKDEIKYLMRKDIISKITSSHQLFPCYSSFNGFAIYRSNIFLQSHYDWRFQENMKFITPLMLEKNIQAAGTEFFPQKSIMDCEHRFFHFHAIFNFGAQMKISPQVLFV